MKGQDSVLYKNLKISMKQVENLISRKIVLIMNDLYLNLLFVVCKTTKILIFTNINIIRIMLAKLMFIPDLKNYLYML